ncbi:salicylate hydroxylase [Palleronia marisminoris]|uniref:3-hydroxybenzoate 6-hydroxylase 1 n=1 Tax=Palleronia marisminoris TaxID=315423 RepID=A0A1Y5RG15_9RHOB|nr:FAD-dependent monooxygenase [Palleronia marisminoris]SFG17441.1 salicylate hydroxylase [Palleronia marisminoris]SLN16646.1 3-hydroxybenzoate 6-hydroxylase 1 [Palleronia marisminoris]
MQPVTVIGAGIAGIAAALALRARGCEVRVLERATALREVGAGLQISPNGYRVLSALGLGAQIGRVSRPNHAVVLADGPTGAEVVRMPLDGPFRLIARPALIDVLADAAQAAGIEIAFAQAVEAPPEGLVLGADGLHSVVRSVLNGADRPFFTKQVAWRATIEGERPEEARVDMGPGRHLVRYPLPDGRVNLVGVEERADWAAEGWHTAGDPDAFRAAFAEFPDARADLDRVEACALWGLFRHPIAERWQDGRLAILGDAAHPTLPFLAQGANLALEDAWTVAAAVEAGDLPCWEAARKPRVRRAIEAANANARNYHLRGARRIVAHGVLRVIGRTAPHALPARFRWLYDHDVTA